ncbi:Flp pilus assembly protein CpaB [Thalassospiraceae bacterium LMO-JJ14]|nr:Flp pilus assembly protein CpaB [Thalassospiraceae bacterium LMO-JJ14]
MFSLRNILLLFVALVFASGTAIYVKSWMESERTRLATERKTEIQVVKTAAAEVLVARMDLQPGTFLKPENLEWQPWPEDGVHKTHIVRPKAEDRDNDAKDPINELQGAVVRVQLRAGEPVTKVRVVHPGERGFLAAVLEPGFRAVSLPVDATTGIAGFIFPGDWVDILMTMKVRDERKEAKQQRYFSQTVLRRVRVLAIDQHVDKEDGSAAVAKTATIEVTPKEAERVTIALEMGRLTLSLNSLSQAESETVHKERLLGGAKPFDPKMVRNEGRSYTLDADVYNMWGDPRLFPGGGNSREVNVLRGSDAQVQSF